MAENRRRANRAVAALAEATGDQVFLGASPLVCAGAGSTPMKPLTRYKDAKHHLELRSKPYPYKKELEEMEALRIVPNKRDESELLGEAVWAKVISYLEHASLLRLSQCSRKLRVVTIKNENFEVVNLVPDFVRHDQLEKEATMESMVNFFDVYTRGQHVRHIACVHSGYDATLPTLVPPPQSHPSWLLQLSANCPLLSVLDVRGVRWSDSPMLDYFLADLHLVAPRLQALKISCEVYEHWVDGWWSRQSDLSLLVISSRRLQPVAGEHEGGEDASSSNTVSLYKDFFRMLSRPGRHWSIKVWCPLDEPSAKALLLPSSPFEMLKELTVNVEGHADIFIGLSDPPTTEETNKKGAKGTKKTGEGGEQSVAFPALHTLTVANLDSRPTGPQEWWRRLSHQAPNLVHFNTCNTSKIPHSTKGKLKKKV